LKDRAYDPCVWTSRGTVLAGLGFPELALGDLWKAQLLCGLARDARASSLTAYSSPIANQCDNDPVPTSSSTQAKCADLALTQFAESYYKRRSIQNGKSVIRITLSSMLTVVLNLGSQAKCAETRLVGLRKALTLLHVEIYGRLAGVLSRSSCFDDAVDLLRTACEQFQGHPAVGLLQDDLKECERRLEEWASVNTTLSPGSKCYGLYTRRPYPWMDERHLK
jgi:hypothetical protein